MGSQCSSSPQIQQGGKDYKYFVIMLLRVALSNEADMPTLVLARLLITLRA